MIRHPDLRSHIITGVVIRRREREARRRRWRRRRRSTTARIRWRRRVLRTLLTPLVQPLAVLPLQFGLVGVFPGVLVSLELGLAICVRHGAALAAANDDEALDRLVLGRILPSPELVPVLHDGRAGVGEPVAQLLLHHNDGPDAVVEPAPRGILAVDQEIADLRLDAGSQLADAAVNVVLVAATLAAEETGRPRPLVLGVVLADGFDDHVLQGLLAVQLGDGGQRFRVVFYNRDAADLPS
jgi:hypothetical protein